MQASGLLFAWWGLLALDTVAAPTPAARDAATCPASVVTEQRVSGVLPSGWEIATDGDASHALMGITFFAGPPAQKASLVGDERAAGKGRKVVSWPLSPSETYWVACNYNRTNVVLQRQLPQGLKTCTVHYATQVRMGGLPQILKIECQ
jgi:hypothetical protein